MLIGILVVVVIVVVLRAMKRGLVSTIRTDNYLPPKLPQEELQNLRERKICDMAQKCSQAISDLQRTRTVRDYLVSLSVICETSSKLKEIKTNVFVSSSIKAYRDYTINAASAIQGERFQWYLRNAIEREKTDALKAIKTTYRNSQTYQQNAFDFFCYDIRSNERYYNPETKAFAEQCVSEIYYLLNSPSRNLPFHNDAADYQRSLLTPSLRYEILKRDRFRCTICGRGQEDGVKLHVDHIKPVSKGGLTTPENLRTLCQDCNLGKSDKYDDNGYN